MTDIVITAANVVAGNITRETGTAGATITAGQIVALDTATGKLVLADTDSATAAVRVPRGVALNGASDGQPLAIAKAGDVTIGGTLEVGAPYFLSGTAGGFCAFADVAAGDYPSIIGMGKTTGILTVDIQAPGVVKA